MQQKTFRGSKLVFYSSKQNNFPPINLHIFETNRSRVHLLFHLKSYHVFSLHLNFMKSMVE